MVDVPVNNRVLVWARQERGLSEEQAAQKLKLTLDELAAFEAGDKKPSVALLDRIAKKYRLPFASLLMPEPLPASSRPSTADFRTHGGKEPVWDVKLMSALDVVNLQIEILTELREHHADLFNAPALRRYAISDSAIEVATKERTLFGVDVTTQMAWPSAAQAFRYWRALVERSGLFVQIMDLGPENLCRGLSIYDERGIPMAVINGDEGEGAARTFTLLHEYAHLLVREPGVSDQNRTNKIERWCNQFAAYFLMPEDRFRKEAAAIDPESIWSDTSIRKLAKLFNVSMSAVALHLEDVGLAKAGLYERKLDEWRKRKKSKGGPPMGYAERQVHRLGVRHTSVVLDAVDRKYINPIEAFELTDVDPKHFPDLKNEVAERQKQYGGVR